MSTVLVLYGTTEGHTRKVAEAIASQLGSLSHTAALLDSTDPAANSIEPAAHDSAIVCGSVHQGKHQPSLVAAVERNVGTLERIPTAFVSVSLAAALPDDRSVAEARGYADEFLRETGWTPDARIDVAGALLYSKYDFFERMLMKLIARSKGSDSDTSRDYEYTDWPALERFVAGFVQLAEERVSASTSTTGSAHPDRTGLQPATP